MNTQELSEKLKQEHDNLLELSRMYFRKWIETGEDKYKENELLHTGSAHAMLTIMNILKQG